MIGFSELCKRANTGPTMSEENFDLDVVYMTARKLCEKYKIVFDPKTPVPSDDALADRVYQAAIDFVLEAGMFIPDTNSIVKFTRDEVLEAIANAPGRCIMGQGKDRYVWTPRKPDSDTQPWYHVGTGIVATDERVAFNQVKGYASIKQANSISIPALDSIDGIKIMSGQPTEILGAIRAMRIARDAARHVGRPGLAIGNCISTAGTAYAAVAASTPQSGMRPSDAWLVGALAEFKYGMSTLNKAAYLASWGANIACESGPLVGGYAGGPAGTAVLNVAYRLLGLLVLQCDCHLTFPIHVTRGCCSMPEVLWCCAVSNQAISRNTKELVWSLGYMAAGPMTKQFFYETAAYIAMAISSGVSAQTCHPARAVLNDYVTPMEKLGSVELIEACVGMTRAQANEMVKNLLPKYIDTLDSAPRGKKYQEAYDLNTGKPTQEYVDLYGQVKDELRTMGFNYKL
ncbi:MAG: monomethylamine:corrinoid methyltransferase [Sedimentisphaerales bacterium]|nr:monomethylamine:corrinoid methyltransferase [Sedimentisphaerales bacterium]